MTQLFRLYVKNTRPGQSTLLQGLEADLPLYVEIHRSRFTKAYAIVVCILMWIIAAMNFIFIMDNVFARPRGLKDMFAPVLLYSLVQFRNTMPGIPQQMGLAIDMLGLVWPELMIAACIVVSFVAFIGQYHHPVRLFKRQKSE